MAPDGARTPEELETLLEDAFVLRDTAALARLFDPRAVLAAARCRRETNGSEEIQRRLSRMWAEDRTYVADIRRAVQSRETALMLGGDAIHVARRGDDRSWRYIISRLGDHRP